MLLDKPKSVSTKMIETFHTTAESQASYQETTDFIDHKVAEHFKLNAYGQCQLFYRAGRQYIMIDNAFTLVSL